MKLNCKWILVLMGMMFIWPAIITAQEKPADNMQLVVEKIRADKKLFIAANMQLTETEAKDFWPVYEAYQNELFLLRTRTIKMIDDYAMAYDKMTNKIAKKLLDEFMSIEKFRPKLNQNYRPKFQKALSEVKTVRYFQIENKINAALMYEFADKIPLIKNAE